MPMKNPPHPGHGIRYDLEALGLTIAEAAKGLGVTRQQLYNVVNGKSAISAEMAVRLEQAIGSTADAWLRMQGTTTSRKSGCARAGRGSSASSRKFPWPPNNPLLCKVVLTPWMPI